MAKKGGKTSHLTKALESHIKDIHETFQMFDKPADSALEKVSWSEVIKLGDEVSKQATIAGMLWNGEVRQIQELEENMDAYFNVLNGFLLICHGSTVGAGPTLYGYVCASAKRVVDCSFSLLREAASVYDSRNPSKRPSTIPQLSGSVWEACTALKKTPTSNSTAIIRSITQVAVSIKDVLREMKEVKSSTSETASNDNDVDENDIIEELGDDLSPEELFIASLVTNVTSTSLDALKELIRFISGLIKTSNYDTKEFVDLLEKVLSYCKETGNEVSELGACVYPPQEISDMRKISSKIEFGFIGIKKIVVESIEGEKERLCVAFEAVEKALKRLVYGLDGGLDSDMEKLAL